MLSFPPDWAIILIIVSIILIKKYFSGGKNNLSSDMTGKIAIITGATGGLGFEHAKNLLASKATVVFACRNKEKALSLIVTLPKDQQNNAKFIPLDLCDFQSIKDFVSEVKKIFPDGIDILVNNAGAQPTNFSVTKDGLESFIQGNHLGPMLLTFLLIDHFRTKGRVIILSSLAHFFTSLSESSVDILSDNKKIKEYYFTSIIGKFLVYNDT